MTTLPASVTIVDLPAATLPLTGAELLEAVQTNAGVGKSVQVAVSALTSIIGGLPTAGATGQILNKTSGANFSTTWSSINSFVNVISTTGLATSGSVTSIIIAVATAGIGSTQLAPNAVQSSNITTGGVGSTQIANNAVGTNQIASSLGIASSLSIGTLLTVGGTATITGTTILNGGLQVLGTTILTGALGVVGTSLITGVFDQVGTSLMTGQFGVSGTALFTSTFGVVGTSQFTGAFNVVGTTLVTANLFGVNGTTLHTGLFGLAGTAVITGVFGVVGTATFTGTHGIVGTTLITGIVGVVGTSLMTGQVGIVGTTIMTGTFILGNSGAGVLTSSATGVVSASSSAGVMTLLNTLTPNGVASATDTTSLTSTYKQYMVMFDNIIPATQSSWFQVQIATTGSAWQTSAYGATITYANAGSTITDTNQTAIILTGIRATTALPNTLGYGVSGFVNIFNPATSTAVTYFSGESVWIVPGSISSTNANNFIAVGNHGGIWNGTSVASPITGLNFQFNSGNIATGTIKIYGIT